jgi:hypothetical protein
VTASFVVALAMAATWLIVGASSPAGAEPTPSGAPDSASQSATIVAAARTQLGRPYCFAGGDIHGPTAGHDAACPAGTLGMDCSGLALYAVYQATGILLPHYSITQYTDAAAYHGVPVAKADLLPGDLVFFVGADGPSPGHVGIYIGNGLMIDAQQSGVPVAVHPLQRDYVGAVRYWTGSPTAPISAPTSLPTTPSDATVHVVKASSGRSCTGYYSDSVPPATIRVLQYATHDATGRGSVPIGVVTVPFRDYVRNVLPSEWYVTWRPYALQAGALATKTVGWYWVNHYGGYLGTPANCFDVTDDTQFQRYVPGNRSAATDAAVAATWSDLVLTRGRIFAAGFRADLRTVGEACGLGATGRTLSQWGSQACAARGMTPAQILRRYYRDVVVLRLPQGSGGAVSDGHGGYHLFTRAANGDVIHTWRDGTGRHTENLGGDISGTVAASYQDGRFDVFGLGPGGATYHRSGTANRWGPWTRISSMALTLGESVVRDAAGHLHVVGADARGTVWHLFSGRAGWAAQPLGGVTIAAPVATYATGRLSVFAVGTNHQLYQKAYADGRWTGWATTTKQPLAGGLSGVVDVTGTVRLFGADGSGTLWQVYGQTGAWTAQRLLGPVAPSSATIYQAGRYDVFVTDRTGHVYRTTYSGTAAGVVSAW